MLGAADAALLRAKSSGRNRVCLYTDAVAGTALEFEGDLAAIGRRFAAFIGLSEAEAAGLVTALAVHETGAAVQDEVQAILGTRPDRRRRGQRGAADRRRGARVRQRALGRRWLPGGTARGRDPSRGPRLRRLPPVGPGRAQRRQRRRPAPPRLARAGPEDGPALHGHAPRRARPCTTDARGPPRRSALAQSVTSFLESAILMGMDNVRPLRPKKQPRQTPARPPHPAARHHVGIVVAVVVLVLVFGSRILGMYVDWLWFGEVGFRSVFWTRIWCAGAGRPRRLRRLLRHHLSSTWSSRGAWRPSYRVDRRRRPARAAQRPGAPLGRRGAAWASASSSPSSPASPPRRSWQTFLLYVKQASFGEKDADLRPRRRLLRVLAADVAGRCRASSSARWSRRWCWPRSCTSSWAASTSRRRRLAERRAPAARETRPDRPRPSPAPSAPPRRSCRRSTSSSAAARSRTSRRSSRRSSSSSASASCSEAGTCCTPPPGAIYGAGYTDVHIRLPLTYVTHGRRLPARRRARLEHLAAPPVVAARHRRLGRGRSSCCAASSRPCTSRSSSTRTS